MEKIQVVQCLGMRVCLGLAFLLVPSVCSSLLLEAGALLGGSRGGLFLAGQGALWAVQSIPKGCKCQAMLG